MDDKEIKKLLFNLREKIKPSKELGQKILADLNIDLQKENKGRLSGYELILNQIHIFMTKWKMAIPIFLVVLVVVGLMVFRSGQKIQPTGDIKNDREAGDVQVFEEIPIPEATGKIDDVIDAMTALAENEQLIIFEENGDTSMVVIDSQAISDFGQSYNENEF